MKHLILILCLLFSCSSYLYTSWADNTYEMIQEKKRLEENNIIVKIIKHPNGVYEIIYKDKLK